MPTNVVIVVADDLGYSDLGCYGGEIRTPNIDQLGRTGVRLSNFYNTARCSPSRASLLTGLHPHQAGVGVLTADDRPEGYRGSLNDRCVTLGEHLAAAGYRTAMFGKWHLSSDRRNPNEAWPTRRGFETFWGMITGSSSYFDTKTLFEGEVCVDGEAEDPDFYLTTAITRRAVEYLDTQLQSPDPAPFFVYVPYSAPHWPLHAPDESIAACAGMFERGWDQLRQDRLDRLIEERILPDELGLSDRDPRIEPWADIEEGAWQQRRMEVYAAQVELIDSGVGQIVDTLRRHRALADTLFLFLSDNGASAEELPLEPWDIVSRNVDGFPPETNQGRPIRFGNTVDILPGASDTFTSYGRPWANLSNSPFRLYKRWVHEGGISTPLIVHWPAGDLRDGSVVHAPCQLTDVVPTVLEATGAPPAVPDVDHDVLDAEGVSMLAVLRGEAPAKRCLYWEHVGNCAIRRDDWKLVRVFDGPWELYDLSVDRAEEVDLAQRNRPLVDELAARWHRWADRAGVIPFERIRALYASRGIDVRRAAG